MLTIKWTSNRLKISAESVHEIQHNTGNWECNSDLCDGQSKSSVLVRSAYREELLEYGKAYYGVF